MADQAGLCFVDGETAAEVIGGDECEGAGCEGDKRRKQKQRKAPPLGMLQKERTQSPKGYVEEAGPKVGEERGKDSIAKSRKENISNRNQ